MKQDQITIAQATELPVAHPDAGHPKTFHNAKDAVLELKRLYALSTNYLAERFAAALGGEAVTHRHRAFYPEIRLTSLVHSRVDSRLAYGYVGGPGEYQTTVTHPQLFADYLETQIELLMKSHNVPVTIGLSNTPIPLHFALPADLTVGGNVEQTLKRSIRDVFDVPDLASTDDKIVNGNIHNGEDARPLAPFTAQRIDYSLHRLAHYTATAADHFQNFVLFTNYQFYMDEFVAYAQKAIADPNSGYTALVEPGNCISWANGECEGKHPDRMPQMPAYHLVREDRRGITMINIGVGPSNAKTMTDHVAVLRPHTWMMLGHCAGLRNSQRLGDYVLAHAYVREDHVLDDDLPVWIPVPALAEVQVAIEDSVEEITGYEDYELKRIMRTGTVATIDNRNWELRDQRGPVQRLSQSRAIALDMESATIAANGFRFRVPYGTLLCVSDKPLHGELKLPGMATGFYEAQVRRHLEIGIRAMEKLREMPPERLHSRKLRSFSETAFQ
ncbi:AMP nucleosidase [Pseudahrensia aquimaris]|uniref:AMP nucleosidase n=1 Tax=Pseudahrensia aquimaris TaxID=744461 RepID=A0ABW3FBJ3_9HYPH